MKIPLSTQPETLHQLLIRSLKLYWQSFYHVFLLSLVIAILIFIPQLMSPEAFANVSFYSPQRLLYLFINLGALTLFTALLWRIRCVITDTHEAITDDLRIALKRIPYILAATFLLTLLLILINFLSVTTIYAVIAHFNTSNTPLISWKDELFVGVLLAIQTILVAYLFIAMYFYLPIIVIEHQGIWASLRKSVRLVWKNWWRTFFVQMTPWLIYFICLLLLKYIVNLNISLFYIKTEQIPTLLSLCVQILVFALFLPWIASTLMIQLRDLELRRNLEEAESKK